MNHFATIINGVTDGIYSMCAGSVVTAEFLESQLYSGKCGAPDMRFIVKKLAIDATTFGNASRWINHSCQPNMRCGISAYTLTYSQ